MVTIWPSHQSWWQQDILIFTDFIELQESTGSDNGLIVAGDEIHFDFNRFSLSEICFSPLNYKKLLLQIIDDNCHWYTTLLWHKVIILSFILLINLNGSSYDMTEAWEWPEPKLPETVPIGDQKIITKIHQ